jgi:hypothetical protein
MKLGDLLITIDPECLIWISPNGSDGLYCGPLGTLTLADTKPWRNYKVKSVYAEKYGAYYNRSGISIIVDPNP